jgi:hypothetical protein
MYFNYKITFFFFIYILLMLGNSFILINSFTILSYNVIMLVIVSVLKPDMTNDDFKHFKQGKVTYMFQQ